MRLSGVAGLVAALVIVLAGASTAAAQPLGTFAWQLAPYCNRVTLTVVQNGSVFTLNGHDDQCGAATSGSVAGSAFLNTNGTIGLGLTIVVTPGGHPLHVDATVDLATLNGTWRDSAGVQGTFTFNGAGGGSPRPVAARSAPLEIRAVEFTLPELQIIGQGMTPNIVSVRTGGTPAAPAATLNGDQLLVIEGAGHDGAGITPRRAAVTMSARENWGAGSHGTTLQFSTTENGTSVMTTRMTVEHNGNVGIGTSVPSERLHVNGAARIGSCTYETDGDVACASDARFKRDVRDLPSMLERLTRLRPVQFGWRAEQFPDRGLPAHESVGLLAQDVESVLPELVTTNADGYKAVNYGRLPMLTLQAVKELKAENDLLRQQNAALERRLSALESRLPQR